METIPEYDTGVSGLADVGVDMIVGDSGWFFITTDEGPESKMDISMMDITSRIMGVEVPEVTRHRSCSRRWSCQILGGSKRRGRKNVVADRMSRWS